MNEDALLNLLTLLKAHDYHFTAVTPATHARVLARRCDARNLRDIFGWNRWFRADQIDPMFMDALQSSDMVEEDGPSLRSRLRVASVGEDLFFHSAFPTDAQDSVFLGPDTYRFVRFVRAALRSEPSHPSSIVDMGAGSGAGAITVAKLLKRATVTAVDINSRALELVRINADAAGVSVATLNSPSVPSGADLVIANPPYMMDPQKRAYRDGGDLAGGRIARDWAVQAMASLAPRGRMLLYTGAAIIEGRSPLVQSLEEACERAGAQLTLEELDPDVFGEELDKAAYSDVERIAVIGATIVMP